MWSSSPFNARTDIPSATRWYAFLWLLLILVQAILVSRAGADAALPDRRTQSLTQKYGVEIITSDLRFPVAFTGNESLSGRQASQKALDAYLPILVAEWNLYPVSLIRKVGLRRIIICDGLSMDMGDFSSRLGAGENKHIVQTRGAVPDYERHDLYLNVGWFQRFANAGLASDNRRYVCEGIHHEFFHCVDNAIISERHRKLIAPDAGWRSLNPEGFIYGKGGVYSQNDPQAGVNNGALVGFLNVYSQSAVEEDKAEIFANMMMDRVGIEERAESDRYIANKIRAMEALLLEFCPDINRAFWRTARTLPRPYLGQEY